MAEAAALSFLDAARETDAGEWMVAVPGQETYTRNLNVPGRTRDAKPQTLNYIAFPTRRRGGTEFLVGSPRF